MKRVRKLEGAHVYLTPVSPDDKQLFFEWMNDMQVTDFTMGTEVVTTLEKEADWIKRISDKGEVVFTICTTVNDEVIGNIALDHIRQKNRTCELGIFIGKGDFRGKGYGREAIKLILDFAFNYYNMHTVHLAHLSCNERARRCYLSCGFKDAGRLREVLFVNGQYYDRCLMDITEDEFRSKNGGSYILNKNVGAALIDG